MKYDSQLGNVKEKLSTAQNILITLPPEASIDELAAALALYLALDQSGKKTSIVTEGIIRVGHSHLFGVGQVQNKLPQLSGGDFIISLGGVVASDGTIPSLEKMDYYPTGADLNLVFKVLPGQKFEPAFITPKKENGGFDLVFTVGATTLDTLGSVYASNKEAFSSAHTVNIDKKAGNAYFGATNIVDAAASSVSEIVASVIQSLQLTYDGDIATNVIAGIFDATSNLQGQNVTAETYEMVASAMRVGGRKPTSVISITPEPTIQPQSVAQSTAAPTQPEQPQQPPIFMEPPILPQSHGTVESFTVPPVTSEQLQSSPEETPTGERAESKSPEADWLTPKIFKGGSVG